MICLEICNYITVSRYCCVYSLPCFKRHVIVFCAVINCQVSSVFFAITVLSNEVFDFSTTSPLCPQHINSYQLTSFSLEFSSCSSELILARGAAIKKENTRRLKLHNSVSWREETTVTMANNPEILCFTISSQLPRNSVSSGRQRFLAEDSLSALMSNLAQVTHLSLKNVSCCSVLFFTFL